MKHALNDIFYRVVDWWNGAGELTLKDEFLKVSIFAAQSAVLIALVFGLSLVLHGVMPRSEAQRQEPSFSNDLPRNAGAKELVRPSAEEDLGAQ